MHQSRNSFNQAVMTEITLQKLSIWIHFNDLVNSCTDRNAAFRSWENKNPSSRPDEMEPFLLQTWAIPKVTPRSPGAPRLPCVPTRSSLQNKLNVVLAAFTQIWAFLHIPVATLLALLELQLESQQAQRLLCAGLSSSSQLIREGRM